MSEPEIGSALTAREMQILELVAQGLTNAEISRKLFVERNTVKTHLHRMGQRLGIGERAGMVSVAYCTGLLRIPEPELMRQATEVVRRQRAAGAA